MKGYYFDEKKRFIIEDYHKAKTFSSFLPGIAGKEGIPVWAFYVNRGQGISSFGIRDKDSPIMEFTPANGAYQSVTTKGFRTFIKDLAAPDRVIELFAGHRDAKRTMGIEKDSFFITEHNDKEGLSVKVSYTTLSNVPFGGLVRQVVITNTSGKNREFEVIDGMPALLPYGVTNEAYKSMGNLMMSWMEVSERDSNLPFYKLRSSTGDSAVVSEIKSGYFYMSEALNNDHVLNIFDASLVFDYQLDLSVPVGFAKTSMETMAETDQVFANKVPSAFQMSKATLASGESVTINSVIGYADDYGTLREFSGGIRLDEFIEKQFKATADEINAVTSEVETRTGLPLFDEYIKQSYLDNVLRGGRPYLFESEKGHHVYHIFSRKHGDLERDYNFFSLEPSKYSQGNGNYRDVNQNRRNDVIINPLVGDFNVWMFYNLVQTDGYNPLSIRGTTFSVTGKASEELEQALVQAGVEDRDAAEMVSFAASPFTPGRLSQKLDAKGVTDTKVFDAMMRYAEQAIDVTFGEGYWSDHFTYNLDLVESYRYIYPDKMGDLLLGRRDYRFFNAPYSVLPRHRKYGLNDQGQVRQYDAITKKRLHTGDWMTDETGNVVTTNLYNKMIVLVLTKFMNLDPSGMGIEMEGERPGWNDALNGLPGLFGSGMSETVELKRHIDFMLEVGEEELASAVSLLTTTAKLLEMVSDATSDNTSDFKRWESLNEIKEAYRSETADHISSETVQVSKTMIQSVLETMSQILGNGIQKAMAVGNGLLPSYFVSEATDYDVLDTKTDYGLQAVKVNAFSSRPLPYFLEGPARYMKTIEGEAAANLHKKVMASPIYDEGIQMFKTSECLEEASMEIGRIRAFTPGWLERESVFLHMTYKYLLSLLTSGQYQAYYEAIKTNMIPFLDPEVYGRPTTENSSFIASSVNPNPAVVGQGFVARLSGSTAELISMWVKMFVGSQGFTWHEGSLTFALAPVLQGRFFDEEGMVSFKLFGKTEVTYINPMRRDTFGPEGVSVTRIEVDGEAEKGAYLSGDSALRLRNGDVSAIKVWLG